MQWMVSYSCNFQKYLIDIKQKELQFKGKDACLFTL